MCPDSIERPLLGGQNVVDLAERQQVMEVHFRFVASIMEALREITERELNENP